jgi:hypothetical protein
MEGGMMRRGWRAVIAALLVVGPMLWLPVAATDAASMSAGETGDVQAALAKKDDPEDLCGSSNPRKQKKCHYNGWDNDNWNQNGNDNHNDNSGDVDPWNGVGTDPWLAGLPAAHDGLTVELWKSTDSPALNAPLMVAVKGDGAQIARIWWWAEGPVYENRHADDMAHIGEQAFDCAGAQPCAWSWNVFPRDAGIYFLHARIRDTSGREVQTDWRFGTTGS